MCPLEKYTVAFNKLRLQQCSAHSCSVYDSISNQMLYFYRDRSRMAMVSCKSCHGMELVFLEPV